jgi:hypothetical protein
LRQPKAAKQWVEKKEQKTVTISLVDFFGINGVVRSGLLLPVGEGKAELDDIFEVASAFAKDLSELYQQKKVDERASSACNRYSSELFLFFVPEQF